MKAQYILNLQIPAGYRVEELPEPARISLPNSAGKLQFSCSKTSEVTIQLVLKTNLTQLHFNPEEYDALRQFFDFIAEKTDMQLVLKRT